MSISSCNCKTDLESTLVRDEGVVMFAYEDTVGKITVGVGRNLDDLGLSEDEVMYLLRNDIERVKEEVERSCAWVLELDSVRRDVVYNMVFNLGISRFLLFTNTIAYLEKGDYMGASVEMLDSKWATQVGIRATRLSETMASGELV